MADGRRRGVAWRWPALRVGLAGVVALALLAGCGGAPGGGEAGGDAATAAARVKGGLEGLQAGAKAGTPQVVAMTDQFRFEPAALTVPRGTTVTWRNDSSAAHTVTANPARARTASNVQLPAGAEQFDSDSLQKGQTFSQQLTVAGEYRYVCRIHEGSGMVGTITVQ